jgi:hypothetical protein
MSVYSLIVGAMLIVSGVFGLLFTRNRRELVRAISYKQFAWCCGMGIIGGALIILLQVIART